MDNDELYQKVLGIILHPVGCSTGSEVGQPAMLSYTQDAFEISDDNYAQLLQKAQALGHPKLKLSVELIEAKGLESQYPKNLCDPYVTMYLKSNAFNKCKTSEKSGTFDPVWNEQFSLPMGVNFEEDSLCFEVWGFITKKIVKTKRLIGSANILLKSIPASGMTMWFNLSKRHRRRWQGRLAARIHFSAERSSVAFQEHCQLLRILLLHELEKSKVAPYWWCGNFSGPAEAILTQHVAQSGLSATDNALAQWSVYCALTVNHPLSFALFNTLLEKIVESRQSELVKEEDAKLFWDGAAKLLPICFDRIRILRDNTVMKSVREVLKILHSISMLEVPDSFNLFPVTTYHWVTNSEEGRLTIQKALHEAVLRGASDWFNEIWPSVERNDESEKDRVMHVISAIDFIIDDLKDAIKHYDMIFKEDMNFAYSAALYRFYDSRVTLLLEPDMMRLGKRMKMLINIYSKEPKNELSPAVQANGLQGMPNLWEPTVEELARELLAVTCTKLYKTFQNLFRLGQDLNVSHWSSYDATKFLPILLDIDAYEALTKIKNHVDLEKKPFEIGIYGEIHGTSAEYTKHILTGFIKKWHHLAWPDIEETYKFVDKIIEVIHLCCVFYSDQMSTRVDNVGTANGKFVVTEESCVAVNNIESVCKSLDILYTTYFADKLNHIPSYQESLLSAVKKTKNVMNYKIMKILKIMMEKMKPHIVQSLEELHLSTITSVDVTEYIVSNFNTMHSILSSDNFSQTFIVAWQLLEKVFDDTIKASLEKKKLPKYFAKLYNSFQNMTQSLCSGNTDTYSTGCLVRMEKLLKLHSMESEELVYQYHLQRCNQQQETTESELGILTVKAQYIEDKLKLEILSCKNLVAMDSNRMCNSYVRVSFQPEKLFESVSKRKTKTQKNNLFPHYDETFLIPLNEGQRSSSDALIHFVVKDQLDILRTEIIGEAYLKLGEVPDSPTPVFSLQQRKLPLTRHSIDEDMIKVLGSRQDETAQKFCKKLRQFMRTPARRTS